MVLGPWKQVRILCSAAAVMLETRRPECHWATGKAETREQSQNTGPGILANRYVP